jgi:predicted glycoside hydrolase/deacetylase ChbG (UPF0249 family)
MIRNANLVAAHPLSFSGPVRTIHSNAVPAAGSAHKCDQAPQTGILIINADDWGRDSENTLKILDCVQVGAVSSVSAMVFMKDSERAADIARELGIDAGIHLNFTTPFSGQRCPSHLAERQHEVTRYLRRHRYASAVLHPRLMRSFEYVVEAQLDEFRRLYGMAPTRIDGHHHMHLCANVLLGGLLPAGTIVRRHFSFATGEKGVFNRLYRRGMDRILARRHRVVDYFFSLLPLEPPARLQRIFSLAHQSVIEIETHPVKVEEYRFLVDGEIFRWAGDLAIAPRFAVSLSKCSDQGSHS